MSKYPQNKRKYTKRNYVEAVEIITPNTYLDEDLSINGKELNPTSEIINSHLSIANSISTYLDISGVAGTSTSSISTLEGISKYFVKQNNLTKVTTNSFNTNILNPLGYSLQSYETSSDFSTFLSGTILPLVQNEPESLESNISTLSAYTDNSDASSVHNYLIENLGWFYFLNTSADGSLAYNPSSFLLDSFNTLYKGQSLDLVDGIKGLTNYIWRNLETCSTFVDIPSNFVAGTTPYTSGTQQLDKLETMLDIVYSPLQMNESDFAVKEAFDDFISADMVLDDYVSKGPHRKINTALGYAFADIAGESESLGLLYDIQSAPTNLLPYIAKLIGWELLGPESDKWRHQLMSAVDIYKSKGTKSALQKAVNMVLSNSDLDVSSGITELWESYVPQLIWYALATESSYFRSLSDWSPDIANKAGISTYNDYSLETNIKIVVDYIILDMYKAYPEMFSFSDEVFPVSRFYKLDSFGNQKEFYAVGHDPKAKTFLYIPEDSEEFDLSRKDAITAGKKSAWEAAKALGPLGYGIYMTGSKYSAEEDYLLHKGDPFFVFNFRGHENFPIPPFEEVKYYEEWRLSTQLLSYLESRLKCFGVSDTFASQLKSYIESASLTCNTNLQSLNTILLLFDKPQNAPNFDRVISNSTTYQKNLLDLWCGKSSHIFLDFGAEDFDFTSTNIDSGGKFGLRNISNVVKKFSPAHAIPKINLNSSATDYLNSSSIPFDYIGLDSDDNAGGYSSETMLLNGEVSGANVRAITGGNTFKRYSEGSNKSNLDEMGTLDSTNFISPTATNDIGDVLLGDLGRKSFRRRNNRFTLPKEGYYDRTGFNGPVSWDPSALENSTLSSQGELTLGYIPSSLSFEPVVDGQASGIWHKCENLDSTSTFYGVDTSNTFPYRGLNPLGSNAFTVSAHDWYVDRGQTPGIYGVMHKVLEEKAKHDAEKSISSAGQLVWNYLNKYNYLDADPTDISGLGWAHSDITTGVTDNLRAIDGTETADLLQTLAGTDVDGVPYYYTKLQTNIYKDDPEDYFTFRTYINVGDGTAPEDRPVVFDFSITYKLIPGSFYALGVSEFTLNYTVSANPFTGEKTTIAYGPHTSNLFGDVGFTKVADYKYPDDNWHRLQLSIDPFDSTYLQSNPGLLDTVLYTTLTIKIRSDNNESDPVSQDRNFHIWGTQLWRKSEEKEYLIYENPYLSNSYWYDPVTSLANKSISEGLVGNTFDSYRNFAFGTDLHKVFKEYTSFFNTHGLGKNAVDAEGFNILAHTFGKGLYNIGFQLDGSAATTSEGTYRTTDLSSAVPISYGDGSGVFSVCAVEEYGAGYASGTYIASSAGDTVIPLTGTFTEGDDYNAEFRNAHILSGVEFVDTSGASPSNAFYLYDIPPTQSIDAKNQYYQDNPLVKCKSVGGFPRIRFDLNSYGGNKLVPNHQFNFSVKALVGTDNSPELGVGVMGVWIHTKSKGGKVWSWAPKTPFETYVPTYVPAYLGPGDTVAGTEEVKPKLPNQLPGGSWVLSEESDLSKDFVVNTLSFKHQFHKDLVDSDTVDENTCLGNIDSTEEVTVDKNATIKNFNKSHFSTASFEFDTRNETDYNNSEYLKVIPVPEDFYSLSELVHDVNTEYVIEIFFMNNSNPSKFLLIDDVTFTDTTLNSMASIPTGYNAYESSNPMIREANQKRYKLSPEELREVLKYFSGLAGFGSGVYATEVASRVASQTSGTMDVSGGSRLSYRDAPITKNLSDARSDGEVDDNTLAILEIEVEN